jgi:hypothetical protein
VTPCPTGQGVFIYLLKQSPLLKRVLKQLTHSGEIMKITLESIEEMAACCAGLVKEGVMFEASKHSDKYIIVLTGGY